MSRETRNSFWFTFGFTLVAVFLLLFGTGCATHNIKLSSDMCRDGALRSYSDEEFSMECQHIDRHVFQGQAVPQTYVKQEAPKGANPMGFYGREIISVAK